MVSEYAVLDRNGEVVMVGRTERPLEQLRRQFLGQEVLPLAEVPTAALEHYRTWST